MEATTKMKVMVSVRAKRSELDAEYSSSGYKADKDLYVKTLCTLPGLNQLHFDLYADGGMRVITIRFYETRTTYIASSYYDCKGQ